MKALFVTDSKYPDSSAESNRRKVIAKIFEKNGVEVLIASLGKYTGKKIIKDDDTNYISLRSRYDNKIVKGYDALIVNPCRVKRVLKDYGKFDIIVVFSCADITLKMLKSYAKKNHVILIHDAVEWYSPCQFKNGEKNWQYKKDMRWHTKYIDSNFRVIVISRYLQKFYEEKGCRTFYLPAVHDVEAIEFSKNKLDDGKVHIIYAGTPGKKDYLNIVIQAMSKIDKHVLEKLYLTIIGINESQIFLQCGISKTTYENVKNHVEVLGRIDRKDVLEKYKNANFSILVRSSKLRYAKAGFPTKVPESMATGTPVICNFTSDLQDYLTDRYNAIVLKSESIDDLVEAFTIIGSLEGEKILELQKRARLTAEKKFDYRQYIQDFSKFIQEDENV